MRLICAWVLMTIALVSVNAQENSMPNSTATSPQLSWMTASSAKLERELITKYGEAQRDRLKRGLRQVSEFWRPEDGDAVAFEEFVRTNFAGDQAALDTLFNRFEHLLEQLGGHMHEISREFRQQIDLDLGPVLPFDEMFGGYDPSAHIIDDFFQNKLAFVVLLNFPLTTLDERLKAGPGWTRRQWAESRLAQRFSKRIPADVNLAVGQAEAAAARYVADYNIWMHHLVDQDATAEPLEPSRRDQSRLCRQTERSRQAAHDSASHGTNRHPDNSGGCRQQSGSRLEPIYKRSEAGGGN